MESEMDNHNGLFCVLWKVSVPHMLQQVGFQIVVIFEPHSGDGFTVQNGGVCLLVNFILLPVTDKEVSGDHQGKSRIRVLNFQIGDAIGGSLAKDVHAWDAVKDSFLLALKLLPGVADGYGCTAHFESLLFLYALGEMIPWNN